MRYSGYQLNPGDMFQVDKNLVMWATGVKKNASLSRMGRKFRAKGAEAAQARLQKLEKARAAKHVKQEAQAAALKNNEDVTEDGVAIVEEEEEEAVDEEEDFDEDRARQQQIACQIIQQRVKHALNDKTVMDNISGKAKRALREMRHQAHAQSTAIFKDSAEDITSKLADWEEQLKTLLPSEIRKQTKEAKESSIQDARQAKADARALEAEKKRAQSTQENPVDPTRPYNTPWAPKTFMAPFAFIPRYLEVNHLVCAAVYLRHPVARKGLVEVPSPFGVTEMSLTHNWYLRRR